MQSLSDRLTDMGGGKHAANDVFHTDSACQADRLMWGEGSTLPTTSSTEGGFRYAQKSPPLFIQDSGSVSFKTNTTLAGHSSCDDARDAIHSCCKFWYRLIRYSIRCSILARTAILSAGIQFSAHMCLRTCVQRWAIQLC